MVTELNVMKRLKPHPHVLKHPCLGRLIRCMITAFPKLQKDRLIAG